MIRKAKIEDIDDILVLLDEVLNLHHQGRPDIFLEHGSKFSYESLKEMIGDNLNPIFVYELDKKVVGHIFLEHIEKNSPNMVSRKELFVEDLCIKKEFRHKGFGTELMNFIKDYAKNNSYDYIALNVWSFNNDAIKFYEKFGLNIRSMIMDEKIK